MNSVVIVFVPTSASQRDFEAVLREHVAPLKIGKAPQQTKADCSEIADNDQWPLWTWFVPNPLP